MESYLEDEAHARVQPWLFKAVGATGVETKNRLYGAGRPYKTLSCRSRRGRFPVFAKVSAWQENLPIERRLKPATTINKLSMFDI